MRLRSAARAMRTLVTRLFPPLALGALAACGVEEVLDPPFRDAIRPRVVVAKGGEAPDSLLAVAVTATDNIGLKRVRLLLDAGADVRARTAKVSLSSARNRSSRSKMRSKKQ